MVQQHPTSPRQMILHYNKLIYFKTKATHEPTKTSAKQGALTPRAAFGVWDRKVQGTLLLRNMLKFRIFWIIRTWHYPKYLKAASSEKWAPQYWQQEQSLVSSLRNSVSIWTVAMAASEGANGGVGAAHRSPLQWARGSASRQKRLCSGQPICLSTVVWATYHNATSCHSVACSALPRKHVPEPCHASALLFYPDCKGWGQWLRPRKGQKNLKPVGPFVTSCKDCK